MGYEIVWSPVAKTSYFTILEYLEKKLDDKRGPLICSKNGGSFRCDKKQTFSFSIFEIKRYPQVRFS